MFKVIFHVDELEKWLLVMENARNFLAIEPDAKIEILANSEAVKFLAHEAKESEIFDELAGNHVVFAACHNAMEKFAIPAGALAEDVVIVPAGVVELAKKQGQGYAYIRP